MINQYHNDNDWRLAIGEISLNLKKEISEKINRQEIYNFIQNEIENVNTKLIVSSYSI